MHGFRQYHLLLPRVHKDTPNTTSDTAIILGRYMLALSPAGATEMTLIAADLGIEDVDLVVLQICRLVGVLMLFPQLFALLLRFSGRT